MCKNLSLKQWKTKISNMMRRKKKPVLTLCYGPASYYHAPPGPSFPRPETASWWQNTNVISV